VHGAPYNPKCQGVIERLNQTIKKDIFSRLTLEKDSWVEIVEQVFYNYNTRIHSVIKTIPYILEHNSEIPSKLVQQQQQQNLPFLKQHDRLSPQQLFNLNNSVAERIKAKAEAILLRSNKNCIRLSVGDQVFVRDRKRRVTKRTFGPV